eukprot:CAMPEP_0182429162 /NCGR_PEP_ID=MMETSP1167-20130531/25560_1 /TAXON_ID=2988 /ORGANISM="Mallomonas Sp, Strain CCMP3275" /LENGTH=460 /DNA_ID=CAMNT_0024612521 /DNA_START=40 /DNA_END=1422 /DNA_ORIENTATION=-
MSSFNESVSMLIEDQTLFESTDFDQSHDALIQSGGLFSKALQKFEQDEKCVESLPLDQKQRIINTITEYQLLLLPPKIFVGCMCLKQDKRSGPEYESRLLTVHAKIIESTYILQIAMRSMECEKISENGKQYSAYASKMNALANTLEGMVVRNNKNAKDEINTILESVEEFVRDFFANVMKESLNEANKRLKKTREILHPDHGKEVTKRSLVTAQANLQEIMNSAASVSASKSKEKMDQIDKEIELLKGATDQMNGAYKQLEEPMAEHRMDDLLDYHRTYAENLSTSLDSRLKQLKKIWKTIRGQSTYRPVAVYEIEMEDYKPANVATITGSGVSGAMGSTVGAAASGAGKVSFKAVGAAAQIAVHAVSAPTKVVTSAGSMAVKGVSEGVTYGVKGVSSGVKGVSDGVTAGVSSGVKGVSDGVSAGVKGVSEGMTAGVKGVSETVTTSVNKASSVTKLFS